MTGQVKNIILNRNFGFIRERESGVEYFFHREDYSGHWDDLVADTSDRDARVEVTFDVIESPKGPRASNVVRTDFPNGVG